MKDDKKLLQLLQRTSDPDHQLFRELPVVLDLETFTVAEPVVVVPRVCELTYVPGP